MRPGRLNIAAYRWTPMRYVIAFRGFDFSAATFAMHVRLYRDATGAALVSLANAAAGSQGISAAVAFDEDGVPTTTVTVQIDEATIEALLPFPTNGRPVDSPDVPLVFDLHLTPDGGTKARWLEGSFTIIAGATH